MCGLFAAFTQKPLPGAATARALQRMQRRGPDGEGVWQEPGVVMGHCRLAVIDLDARAAQPMASHDGRYMIVFNGEIYNFRDLRTELASQGIVFRTSSDTEVILALFARDGEAMLPRLQGMFALVIWDRAARRAFAARDPYGIKPLYVAQTSDGVLLGSQVKALLATGLVSREPDHRGQAGFWMLGSVPEPHTWYRDIQALQAGHFAWIENSCMAPSRSWQDIGNAWRSTSAIAVASDDVHDRVRAALRESVERHLVADVPVGVFLSGGIDSGTLAGLMVEAGARQLKGITLAYDEFAGNLEDEAPIAARIAAHYGIRHHVRRVTRKEFLADRPRIIDAMDQPSIDGINTWFASKAVAEHGLKVVVSGVGGDELFQGYSTFQQLPRLVSAWKTLSNVPGAPTLARLAGRVQATRTGIGRWRYAGEWAKSMPGAYWLRRSLFSPAELPLLMGTEAAAEALSGFSVAAKVEAMSGALSENPRMALSQMESTMYLRNQLLRDSDWASMDHSVELRTPLVDAHLLQQVQSLLPLFERFPNKALLSQAPNLPLPRDIIERPKTGFGIPVGSWRSVGRGAAFDSGSRGWAREIATAYELP